MQFKSTKICPKYAIMSKIKWGIFMEFEKAKLAELKQKFDSIINTEEKENIEFWYARDLQKLLGYTQWRNFLEVMKKAMISCESAGFTVFDHFAEVSKMIKLAKGAKRKVQDYMLTRYGCYLIAQKERKFFFKLSLDLI